MDSKSPQKDRLKHCQYRICWVHLAAPLFSTTINVLVQWRWISLIALAVAADDGRCAGTYLFTVEIKINHLNE